MSDKQEMRRKEISRLVKRVYGKSFMRSTYSTAFVESLVQQRYSLETLELALETVSEKGGCNRTGFRFSDSNNVVLAFADLQESDYDLDGVKQAIETAPHSLESRATYYKSVENIHDVVFGISDVGDIPANVGGIEYAKALLSNVPSIALRSGMVIDQRMRSETGKNTIGDLCSAVSDLFSRQAVDQELGRVDGVYVIPATGVYNYVHIGLANFLDGLTTKDFKTDDIFVALDLGLSPQEILKINHLDYRVKMEYKAASTNLTPGERDEVTHTYDLGGKWKKPSSFYQDIAHDVGGLKLGLVNERLQISGPKFRMDAFVHCMITKTYAAR